MYAKNIAFPSGFLCNSLLKVRNKRNLLCSSLFLENDRMTSTEVTYGTLNDKIEWLRIETVNLTEISVELDSSAPCEMLPSISHLYFISRSSF